MRLPTWKARHGDGAFLIIQDECFARAGVESRRIRWRELPRSDRTSLFAATTRLARDEKSHQPPVRQQESLEPAARTLLALTEQAIARIHQGLEVEAALHELAAALRELQALRTRDPGVRMAAQDVYEAAAALVIDKRAGAVVTDTRRWRLLKQADWRLRGRLASGDAT